jgi:hypothetical protein
VAVRKEEVRELKRREKGMSLYTNMVNVLIKLWETLSRFSVRDEIACILISDADCRIDFTMHRNETDKQEPFRR